MTSSQGRVMMHGDGIAAAEHFEIVNKRAPEPDSPREQEGFSDFLQNLGKQLGVAAALCTGLKVPAHGTRGGFFHGIVDDAPTDTTAARDRFIVETMPTLKQLDAAEKLAEEKGVPLVEALQYDMRQDHMKKTVEGFRQARSHQPRKTKGGVLRFLLQSEGDGIDLNSVATDGPLIVRPLLHRGACIPDDPSFTGPTAAQQKRAIADNIKRHKSKSALFKTLRAAETSVEGEGAGAAGASEAGSLPTGVDEANFVATPSHESSAVNWWESNVALIGSQENRDLRKRAAETEPAWFTGPDGGRCGASPGIEIWRIEQFKVVPWTKPEDKGTFNNGDAYIILHTSLAPEHDDPHLEDSEKLVHHVYFWLGLKAPIDAQGTAAYKTVELDDLLDGKATQHREVMSHESDAFRALFPQGVKYLEGGAPSGFRSVCDVDLSVWVTRLLQIKRVGKQTVLTEVECSRSSLNEGDAFILDTGKILYTWFGKTSSPFVRSFARMACEELENARAGQAVMTDVLDSDFWRALRDEGAIKSALEAGECLPTAAQLGRGILYRLHEKSNDGSLKFDEVNRGALDLSMLLEDDVYLCDPGTEIIVWVGKGASDRERRAAMLTATKYLAARGKPHTTPIKVFKTTEDAMKDESFAQIFAGC